MSEESRPTPSAAMAEKARAESAPSARVVTNSLFEEPWWLDAVAPGRWREITVTRSDAIVARLPYVLTKRHGLTAIVQPPLTPTLGPWIDAGKGAYTRRLSTEMELLAELIAGLPTVHAHYQQLSLSLTNALPFIWEGYTATPRYTYRIEDLTDPDRVWSGFRSTVRGHVRKAQKQYEVRSDLDLEVLLELDRETRRRQSAYGGLDEGALRRIDVALAERGGRRLLVAVDADGQTQAALYLVWDSRCLYTLASGQRGDTRSGGAPSLLQWEAIQHAATVVPAFDFEGSIIPSIERFYRDFGGQPTQYFEISRTGRWLGPLLAVRQSLQRRGSGA